jgi:integrase
MRIGEVLARSVKDLKGGYILVNNTLTLNENNNVILGTHTKTYKRTTGVDSGIRTIPLSPIAKEIIARHSKVLNTKGIIFYDYSKNDFYSVAQVNAWLYRLNNKYKIVEGSLTSHKLRHTYITRLQEKGIALPVIQYLCGHVQGSSITTDVYTSVSEQFIEQEFNKIKQI